MFERKRGTSSPSTVLVPLYVYPNPGAWDPLFTVIAQHPTLNFIVVINPNSGPGSTLLPDENYSHEIPKLNAYPNVRTVGYISTSWANRALSSALQDISTYSGWSKHSTIPGLNVQGIFFDETPSVFTTSGLNFLDALTAAIKFQPGLGVDPLIIHNPGTIPDPRYLASCNLTVLFEGSYSTYKSANLQKNITAFQKSSKLGREATACIVHDVPSSISSALTRELRGMAGSVFVTGLAVSYYASFWEGWQEFVDEIEK